jgi:hypothetical protein
MLLLVLAAYSSASRRQDRFQPAAMAGPPLKTGTLSGAVVVIVVVVPGDATVKDADRFQVFASDGFASLFHDLFPAAFYPIQ